MVNKVKIRKGIGGNVVKRFKPTTMVMDDFKFNPELFVPMKTNKKIDNLLSSEGGLMKGTNVAFVGDPGVGKTTVLLDILADLKSNGSKTLFISGEMNAIDMVGYAPSSRDLPCGSLTAWPCTQCWHQLL